MFEKTELSRKREFFFLYFLDEDFSYCLQYVLRIKNYYLYIYISRITQWSTFILQINYFSHFPICFKFYNLVFRPLFIAWHNQVQLLLDNFSVYLLTQMSERMMNYYVIDECWERWPHSNKRWIVGGFPFFLILKKHIIKYTEFTT